MKKKKFNWFFNDPFYEEFERMRQEMEDMIEKMFSNTEENFFFSKPNSRVYGVSIRVGKDGKPVIREFGNVLDTKPQQVKSEEEPTEENLEDRKPLVDIFDEKDKLKIIAEMPGVEEKDVNLKATQKTLTISASNGEWKYNKKINLPAQVDPKSMKKKCRNGILEITLNKKK